jgi:hypothetical protein
LNPVSYKYKDSQQESIGLIAHEVQQYYPFLVDGEKDGTKTQSVNYTGLIGVLIKEIQELKKKIEEKSFTAYIQHDLFPYSAKCINLLNDPHSKNYSGQITLLPGTYYFSGLFFIDHDKAFSAIPIRLQLESGVPIYHFEYQVSREHLPYSFSYEFSTTITNIQLIISNEYRNIAYTTNIIKIA